MRRDCTSKGQDKQSLKRYLVSGSECPLAFFEIVDCSDGAAALKGSMTYGST